MSEKYKNINKDDDYTLAAFLKGHIVLVLLTFGLTATVFIAYLLNFHASISDQNADWGTFGDFIGGTLNPIFGFISVILLFYAVTLQRKELKGTKDALESQSKSAEITTEIQLITAMLDFFAKEIEVAKRHEDAALADLSASHNSLDMNRSEMRSISLEIEVNKGRVEYNKELLGNLASNSVLSQIDSDCVRSDSDDKEIYEKMIEDRLRFDSEITSGLRIIQRLEIQLDKVMILEKRLVIESEDKKEQLDLKASRKTVSLRNIDVINARMENLFYEYHKNLGTLD